MLHPFQINIDLWRAHPLSWCVLWQSSVFSKLLAEAVLEGGKFVLCEGLELYEFFKFSVDECVYLDVVLCARHLVDVIVSVVSKELGDKHFLQVTFMALLCFHLKIG